MLGAVVLLAGCIASSREDWRGPTTAAAVRTERWDFGGDGGFCCRSEHYELYTTLADRAAAGAICQVLEGAYAQYRALAPQVAPAQAPLRGYLFATRQQWARYTQQRAGSDAAVYLRISRGGYTAGAVFAAYDLGPDATAAVIAHEGWHQYVGAHFRGRIPPFLEEGLACVFEQVQWKDGLPQWNRSRNDRRQRALRGVLISGDVWPLEQLAKMHAGQIVDQRPLRIEAFYAQSWAFARFLVEADGGRFRPGLRQLLADAAEGTVRGNGSAVKAQRADGWDPESAGPALEDALRMSLGEIQRRYGRFMRQIADDRYPDDLALSPMARMSALSPQRSALAPAAAAR